MKKDREEIESKICGKEGRRLVMHDDLAGALTVILLSQCMESVKCHHEGTGFSPAVMTRVGSISQDRNYLEYW